MEGNMNHNMGDHVHHHVEDHTINQMDSTYQMVDNMDHQMQGHSNHIHQAFFNIGRDVPILFSSWNLNTKTGIFLTCLGAIILGVLFQGVKCLRQYIHRDFQQIKRTIKSREHLLQSLLYMIQILSSYVLMLIIMTFNVWVFIATVLGLSLGYFLCGWASPKPSQQEYKSNCSGGCRSQIFSTSGKEGTEQSHELQELQPLNDDAECQDLEEN